MKVKVLKYANDGNTLVRPYVELEKFPYGDIENCFVKRNVDKNDFVDFDIYLKLSEKLFVFWFNSRPNPLQDPSTINKLRIAAADFANNWKDARHVSLLMIEVAKELGHDTAPLWARRNEQIKEREEKAAAAQLERERKQQEAQAAYVKSIDDALIAFKSGEHIDSEKFITLIRQNNIEAHPRTIGLIRSGNLDLSPKSIRGAGNNRRGYYSKVFDLIDKLVAATKEPTKAL